MKPLATTKFTLKVLVADDQDMVRRAVVDLFYRFGIDAVSVSTGHEAVELLRNREFDLVVMDIEMPRMNGIKASMKIRALAGRQPYIVICTGLPTKSVESLLKSSTINKCLQKPFGKSDLERICEEALQYRSSSVNPEKSVHNSHHIPIQKGVSDAWSSSIS